jgi:S-(hydroxymethyl)glutathione dehydrogenase / alcohol dehydrogenase
MKAAVLHEVNKPLVIEDVSVPNPGPREVLIRTRVAGLCHSDLHFMEGLYPHPLPAVLGHESAGVVEKVGSDVHYVKPGDHVVTCLSVFCGTCDNCSTGRTVLCTDTTVKMLPGQSNRLSWARSEKLNQFLNLSSFAEQMLVHENAIVKIRKDMPLELAALIGCGVITGYGAVVNTAGVTAGETVAVIGCGGVAWPQSTVPGSPALAASSRSTPIRPSCNSRPNWAPPISSIRPMVTWSSRCATSPMAA